MQSNTIEECTCKICRQNFHPEDIAHEDKEGKYVCCDCVVKAIDEDYQ